MKKFMALLVLAVLSLPCLTATSSGKAIRILVITGNHDYNKEKFNEMLGSLGENITCLVMELPGAFDMFRSENRNKYDVLVFYHMWQQITNEEASVLAECIRSGKPLVALHHSICAFDDWPEYVNIIGGKYFHKPTTINGKQYQPCSYIHDLKFTIKIADPENPVTKGLGNFEVFDETYKGYYVSDDVKPLLTTDEPSSTNIVGWTKKYGKSRVVTLQSGHDTPTFENPGFRRLLKQSIEWVSANGK